MHPTDAILPNGRIAAPAGASTFVGTGTLGMALSPDGRYAILSNAGSAIVATSPATAATGLVPGSSLAVVNARTMRVAGVYHDPSASFFMGVAAVRDPHNASQTIVLASDAAAGSVRVFDLDALGTLTPVAAIALPGHSLPAQISTSSDGRSAYVADNLKNAVVEIDVASRSVVRSTPVGDFPLYLTAGRGLLLASGGGLSAYAPLAPPAAQPQFSAPAFDSTRSSTLSVFTLAAGDAAADPSSVPMDRAPDGTENVGGAAPGPAVISKDGSDAYVALANVDRVAVVSLAGTPRVVRGLDLRLYPGAPFGAQPSAEALSPDGKRLYVALAGLDAVAVLDAKRPTRYRFGLIPTGWYPNALALSPNGRYLYVTAEKGVNGWGILQRMDLKKTSLVKATLAALRYNRRPSVAKFDPVVPALRSEKRSATIDHVVYIAVGSRGYDAMLGDLKDDAGTPHGNGDASLTAYNESVTPNLHALARSYALADNFYASDADPDLSKQFGAAGEATLYQEMVAAAGAARAPLNDHGDDPEDYARNGYLFNALARAGLSFRDYGGLLRLSGYDGSLYHYDVPALAALSGNVNLAYSAPEPKPTAAPKVTRPAIAASTANTADTARAAEFVRDMGALVQADREPSFTYIRLPAAGDSVSIADADHALGTIVDFLSRSPHWSSTAIFIVPEGIESPGDHVNAWRSYALLVSPLAKRGYVGDEHLSAASVVKTEEEIFGLPPLDLNDLLASDMASFFTDAPNPETYQAR